MPDPKGRGEWVAREFVFNEVAAISFVTETGPGIPGTDFMIMLHYRNAT